MADEFTTKKVTDLESKTSPDLTDEVLAGDKGTNVIKRFTVKSVLEKIADVTFSGLTTTAKKLIEAINELKDGVDTLNSNKLNKTDVANNVTTSTAGKVLDARQGKLLYDEFINYLIRTDVVNNLTTTVDGKALDARQGKTLNDKFANYFPKTGGDMTGYLKMQNGKEISWGRKATIFSSGNQHLYARGSDEGNYAMHLGVHDGAWTVDPDVNGQLQLGTGNHKWASLYANSGTIQTSDRDLKHDIKDVCEDERYKQFFLKLMPKSFMFNDGKSGRVHIGFISQDVEEAMNEAGLSDIGFAGFCKDQKTVQIRKIENVDGEEVEYFEDEPVPGEYVYSLRYEEFIALNTMMIQMILKRLDATENNE